MKPTPVGTPVKLTTDAGLQSVDVPTDATHAVLFFTSWTGGLGINLDAATAGSFFSSLTRAQTPPDSAFNMIGVAWAAVTATGTQTITPAWTNAPGSGPVMVLLFYKDVDSIVDLEAATLAGAVSFDLSAPDSADTLVVAAESQDGSAPAMPESAWTDVTDHAGNGIGMRVRSANTTANPTTVASVGSSYPAVAAIAIKGTSGGGGTEHSATPANSNGGATVSGTTATQNHLGQPAGSSGGATVASTSATQTYRATAAASNSGATVASTTAEQSMAQITLGPLKNNTGTLLASQTGVVAHIYAVATGNKIVSKTGLTTDAAGMLVFSDAAMVVGTEYRVVIVLGSGAEGMAKASAA